MSQLLDPYALGKLGLRNRLVMAPMSRNRSPGGVPTTLNARYYAQRAAAGLVIGEATQVSWMGQGNPDTPGIHSERQREGWARVVDLVHAAGGTIYAQLWHAGRASHPAILRGRLPVAPSPIAADGMVYTEHGWRPFVEPRALSGSEIPGIVDDFRIAAIRAQAAGFDGVEIHAAYGYLLDQFLQSGTNHRRDAYGGSVANRLRLTLEVVEAVLRVWPAERVGVRISPGATVNDISDDHPGKTFGALAVALAAAEVGHVHVVEPDLEAGLGFSPTRLIRELYRGTVITNGGLTPSSGATAIEYGHADLVAFGELFIANPDLPDRIAHSAHIRRPDDSTFYGGGEEGYVDYPTLDEEPCASRPRGRL